MSYNADDDKAVPLNDKDRKVLQEIGAQVLERLQELESFTKSFERATQVNLSVARGRVALQVRGQVKAQGAIVIGPFACWRDPPGICEPGICPEDILEA